MASIDCNWSPNLNKSKQFDPPGTKNCPHSVPSDDPVISPDLERVGSFWVGLLFRSWILIYIIKTWIFTEAGSLILKGFLILVKLQKEIKQRKRLPFNAFQCYLDASENFYGENWMVENLQNNISLGVSNVQLELWGKDLKIRALGSEKANPP